MFTWIKRGVLSLAILGLLAAAPAGAQDEPMDMGMADEMMPLAPRGGVPGQYIVVLNDDVTNVRGAASEMARAHGLGLQFIYTNALKGFAASVPEGRLAALERDPRIAYIEQDQWGGIEGRLIAGIDRVNADLVTNTAGTTIIDGVDDLWVDVDVAVIDTGIQIDHPDLNVVASMNCTAGSRFSPACEAGTGGAMHWHGTHVGGTIGALDNGHDAYYYNESIDVVGVAPGARLWAVRVLDRRGSGTTSQYIAGADWVAANAGTIEVANSSLGYPDSQAICEAVDALAAAGVTHTVSAGNEDALVFKSPGNCGDSVITTSAMADYDGAPGGLGLPTCSSDPDDTRASFSNYGPLVDITGPGVCVVSTSLDSWYAVASGTSMSAPHAAGAAALLVATNPGYSPAQIKAKLQSHGNLGWTDNSGDGEHERMLDVTHSDFTPVTVVADAGTTNNPPSISAQVFSVDENSPNGTVVGTVLASDPDAGDSLTFAITAGNTGTAFAIDSGTGDLTVNNSGALDFETTSSFALTVRVTDSGDLFDEATVTVNLNDVAEGSNNPPSISAQSFSVDENSPNGTVVGTVAASDPDAGDSLTFAITAGNTDTAFAIDSGTGELTVANSAALDFETTPSFALTVRVTDSGGLFAEATVTVNLNDVAEGEIILTATLRGKVSKKTGEQKIRLEWSGATGTNVDVKRDGAVIATTANDGTYTDSVPATGAYTYEVCEAGTATCSNSASVAF